MNTKTIFRLALLVALSTSLVMASSFSFAADTKTQQKKSGIVGPAMKPPLAPTSSKVQILNDTQIPLLNKKANSNTALNTLGRQYNYTAMLKAATNRKGKINIKNIIWTCRGTQCTARGPWQQPAVKSCNQLAMKVGQITGYGHPGKKLGIGQIVQCNRGVISTGINLAGKINKHSNVFGSSVTKQIKVPFEPTKPSERVPLSNDQPLLEPRVMSRNPVMLDNPNSNSALVSIISPNISTSTDVADIKISRRGRPSIESVQTVYLQGSGNVEEANIRYTIEVFNDGNATGNYKIVTTVLGSPRAHVSDTFGIVASERQTQTINIRSQYRLRSRSMRLPITIQLTNPVGRVIGQYSALADMGEALARWRASLGSAAGEPTRVTADLSLSELNLRVSVQLPPGPILRWFGDAFGARTQGYTSAAVTIKNTGEARWGYPGRVIINYQGGRGDNVYRLEGVINGAYAEIPRGIQPSDTGRISLSMPKALVPGFYYTATVRIESDSDQVALNNVRAVSFFVENNGSVTQHRVEATPRRVGVVIQR